MKKIFFVFLTEIKNRVLRPTFWIFTLGLPVVAFLLTWGFTRASGDSQESLLSLIAPSQQTEVWGFVDQSGLLIKIPADLEEAGVTLERFADTKSADAALLNDEIAEYYVFPEDLIEQGEYYLVTPDFSPLEGAEYNWAIDWMLTLNLLGGNEELAAQVQYPMIETRISKSPDQPAADQDNPLAFAVPYAITIFFYMMIFSSASMMLNSISSEKQNRVIEVLLLSVSPHQLLVGKIVALGLIGMAQTGIYIGIGTILLKLSGRSFEAAANFDIPQNLIVWGVVFFLLGYSIYASLMAGAGALAPNAREASQLTFILIIPLIIPLFFISILITRPNDLISVLVSMFPFSAPVAMMTRIAAGGIPWWHPVLAAVIMAATAYLIIILVARLFRAQTLLSGQEVKPLAYFKLLFSRG
ncbi:MAG: ABC transporter permease [Anaerolineales bacterium]|nr:ABC transporter permease [Anaerolineales bacterium]